MKTKALCILLFVSLKLFSQHEHHTEKDTANGPGEVVSTMYHAFSLHLPMNRNGSGTAWLPDSTPMFGYMKHTAKWMFMFHGNLFIRYNHQDVFNAGSRGGEKADAVSWLMLMGQRRVAKKGLFRFSAMVSPDALFGGNGYPLLFQTGESWKGEPLVDRQHPHDLFSELSLAYTYSVNKKTDVYVYAGYPGEPAIGSVAFMHRVSSLYNPDAPLSHHWNDATHITFGTVTGGFRFGKFKLESSVFTGREPDAYRYDFDEPRFDSYSARLSFNPNAYLSFQASHGFLHSPEYSRPDEDIRRSTASVTWSKPLNAGNFLNASFVWAMNQSDHSEHTALAEAVLALNKVAVYGRYEFVQKSAEELNIESSFDFDDHSVFSIHAVTLGCNYDISRSQSTTISFGAQVSCFAPDKALESLYGRFPVSAEVYIRIYPPRMRSVSMR